MISQISSAYLYRIQYEYGGQYKTDDNVILEVDADGNHRVRFRPISAADTPKAMEQLELAYLAARDDANIDQLLLIPCVILDFLSTLYLCYKELDKRFAVVNGKRITKKARIEATVLNSLTPLSKAEICKTLPDVSPTTVEAVLGAMVKSGAIKRLGTSRAARYIKM